MIGTIEVDLLVKVAEKAVNLTNIPQAIPTAPEEKQAFHELFEAVEELQKYRKAKENG